MTQHLLRPFQIPQIMLRLIPSMLSAQIQNFVTSLLFVSLRSCAPLPRHLTSYTWSSWAFISIQTCVVTDYKAVTSFYPSSAAVFCSIAQIIFSSAYHSLRISFNICFPNEILLEDRDRQILTYDLTQRLASLITRSAQEDASGMTSSYGW
ncbi:hypothetical protein RND81_10G002800 [Saponaria officinalis]|uniref:Uncharacterized protein n=1 Tax=Saponaria officinalis TaxID=3572 RepID=A0AAW1HYN5_SAPOF